MKSFAALLLVPVMAAATVPSATTPPAYAKRWPLILAAGDGGAYRVTLSPEVYATAATLDLRDVAVLDADGQEVAAAVLGPEAQEARPIASVAVPWFVLPSTSGSGDTTLRLSAKFDDNGRILQLHTDASPAMPAGAATGGLLVDLSSVREGVQALEIDWQTGAPFEAHYRVESSFDLQAWESVHARSTLLDLQRDGERLRQNEILIPGGLRYLRLLPLTAHAAVPITAVRARLDRQYFEQHRSSVELQGRRMRADAGDAFVYQNTGRYPAAQATLRSDDAALGQWTLASRNTQDASWRFRAGPWIAWQVGGAQRSESPPQALHGAPVRDGEWQLSSNGPLPSRAPRLRLLYRPEVLVFLAQGRPPYMLVAGSGQAARTPAPIPALVQALRSQRGGNWQPTPAYLGVSSVLAGAQALQPPAPQRDWKTWLLWALLAGGAATVAGVALSLLKKPTGGTA